MIDFKSCDICGSRCVHIPKRDGSHAVRCSNTQCRNSTCLVTMVGMTSPECGHEVKGLLTPADHPTRQDLVMYTCYQDICQHANQTYALPMRLFNAQN